MKVALLYRFSVLLKDKSAGIMHAHMDAAAEVAIWIIQGVAFFFPSSFFYISYSAKLIYPFFVFWISSHVSVSHVLQMLGNHPPKSWNMFYFLFRHTYMVVRAVPLSGKQPVCLFFFMRFTLTPQCCSNNQCPLIAVWHESSDVLTIFRFCFFHPWLQWCSLVWLTINKKPKQPTDLH